MLKVVSCHPDLRDLLFSRGLGTAGFSIWSLSTEPRLSLHFLRRSCVQQVSPVISIPPSPCFPHRPSIFGVPKVGLDSMRDHDFEMQITGPPPSIGIEFSIPHHARERHTACVLDTEHPCAYAVGNLVPRLLSWFPFRTLLDLCGF